LEQNQDTCEIGVQLLKITSEEFSSTKEDLLSTRKNELKNLLMDNLQNILSMTTLLLNIVGLTVMPTDELARILEKSIHIISIGSPLKKRPTELDPQTEAICRAVFGMA